MFCHRCGCQLGEGHSYCSSCGTRVAAATASPAPGTQPSPRQASRSRVEEHRQALGLLWMAAGVLNAIAAGAMFLIWRIPLMEIPLPFFGPHFVQRILYGSAVLVAAKAIACLIAGYGLLEREPWARTIALVVGIISLLNVPLGTALGIYTLWVLLPAEPAPGVAGHAAQPL